MRFLRRKRREPPTMIIPVPTIGDSARFAQAEFDAAIKEQCLWPPDDAQFPRRQSMVTVPDNVWLARYREIYRDCKKERRPSSISYDPATARQRLVSLLRGESYHTKE